MASNSEEYELNCFGKCVDKCSIFAEQVINILIYTTVIISVGVIVLITIGGIGVNIYNAIYHISPFGSYDNNQRKSFLSFFGFLAIAFWIGISCVTIVLLCKYNSKNVKMYCVSICRPILYTKVSECNNVQQYHTILVQNVTTDNEMV